MNDEKQSRRTLGQRYHILIAGELDPSWSSWLSGMEITSDSLEGETLTSLSGMIPDQAALRGILNKLWDLRMTLVSVNWDQDRFEDISRR